MEISVPINEINTRNVYFGEKRKNIIVDGDFVKIIYSTDSFEMNGLYILVEIGTRDSKGISTVISAENTRIPNTKCRMYFPDYEKNKYNIYIEDQNVVKSGDARGEWVKIVNKSSIATPKRNIILNILTKENAWVIEQLCRIETEIVDRYIASNCPLKTASYVLKNQLLSGSIKYHSENYVVDLPLHSTPHPICESSQVKEECILKISGIWETTTNVGITMKFILLQNCL